MRGYRRLREADRLGLITTLKHDLTNTRLGQVGRSTSALIMGAGVADSELIVRQYLLVRVVGSLNLNKSLLYVLGTPGAAVIHPLPRKWQRVLQRHGFRVSRFWSSLAWIGLVALLMAYGVAAIVRDVLRGIVATAGRPGSARGRYAYFNALTSGNLPHPSRDGRSHDIVTWYEQWPGRIRDLDTLCHGVKGAAPSAVNGLPVVAASFPVPPLNTLPRLMRFIGWGIAATVLAGIEMLRGRWWHALLLSEAAAAAVVRAHAPSELARDYLFHNARWIYRPLWTYDAEQRGARISFYFYSTNCEDFKRPDGYREQNNSWQAMNWPLYLVWDDHQADFVRRSIGDRATIQVVGPVWFHTSAKEMPVLPPAAVAVFDVQPQRACRHRLHAVAPEYATPATANCFLLDIQSALEACGAVMVLKRKRNIGGLLHPHYARVLEKLGALGNFIAIDPDVSALRVIEQCEAVISTPFSTTALQARHLGKPSIYYDPHGIVQKDDRAAHGVPIVTGYDELTRWLSAQVGLSASTKKKTVTVATRSCLD